MFTDPKREKIMNQLDKIVDPLPEEAIAYFKYWTKDGLQSTLLSDWQLLVLRLLWKSGSSSSAVYKPMIKRLNNETWQAPMFQSMTIFNKGEANATLLVDGESFIIEPRETHSWTPPGDNILHAVDINATDTILVIDYLVLAE